jgi:nitroreductase
MPASARSDAPGIISARRAAPGSGPGRIEEDVVELTEAVRARRSSRSFTAEEVPADTVREILEQARWAPSWANTQAWNVHVVSGEPLVRLKRELHRSSHVGEKPAADLPMPGRDWPEYLQQRMPAPVRSRYLAEPREGDVPAPAGPHLFDFYGAPCLLLFSIDARLVPAYACFDTGMLVQTVCLLAADRGLGTCIMAMVVRRADVLHRVLPRTEGLRFVVGVALGHLDPEAAANAAPRERADVDEIATWLT